MEITLKYIGKKFKEYNEKYFNNELPPIVLQLLKSYKICGRFSYVETKRKGKLKSPILEISCYYDWNEYDLCNIIVHEMIHYYLAYKQIDVKLTHGTEFNKMAKKLNKTYGLNITEKINCKNFKRAKDAPILSWFFTNLFY